MNEVSANPVGNQGDGVSGTGAAYYVWRGLTPERATIPATLASVDQWVLWKAVQKPGGGANKIPYQVNGSKASSTDPATWDDFETVWAAYEESPAEYAGIGFVIAKGDRFIGGDLDHCRDGETGELTETARKVVSAVGTYWEITPSGTGLRFIAEGEQSRSFKGNGIEVYTSGRFLTITGRRLPSAPREPRTIPDRYLERLREIAKGKPNGATPPNGHDHAEQGDPIIEALKARGLYQRALQDGRHLVTCPWADEHSGGDMSGTVYMEPYFNGYASPVFRCQHSHCEDRSLRDLKEFLGLSGSDVPGDEQQAPIDLGEIPGDFDVRTIVPRPWVIKDRLLRGYVSILAAPPGCGKTAFEIASAVAVATGRGFTGEEVREQGPAWLYANEEDRDELLRRFGAFCLLHELDPQELRDRVRISSGYGRSLIIAKRIESTGQVIPTPVVPEMIAALKTWGCTAFAVDPLISTHRVNENSNADLEAVMDQWRYVAREANCAVEIPTHIPKSNEDSEAHAGNLNAIRGASSIGGAARQVATLARMSKKTAADYGIDEREARALVRLDLAKGNYSPPAEDARWLRMEPVCLDNDPLTPDWVGVFRLYDRPLVRVQGQRERKNESRDSAIRYAIEQLGMRPGESRRLADCLDALTTYAGFSQTAIRDALPAILPLQETCKDGDEYFYSKEPRKAGGKPETVIYRIGKFTH